MTQTVKEAIAELEEDIGRKLPKGCTVCRTDYGTFGLIFGEKVSTEEQTDVIDRMAKVGCINNSNLRDYCSGDYVKVE